MKQISINNIPLKVKLALTPKQQAKGLMNVSNMPKDQGMLFCYPEEKILSFWMKSTPLPLSIAFIDRNKKIIQIVDLEPNDEASVKSNRPAKWALEVNQKWFELNGVKVGDFVKIPQKQIAIHIQKDRA